MQDRLVNSVGQSLLAIGLYTVAFESLVLTVKDQMHGYLVKNDPHSLKKFFGSLGTANNTLKFCEPKLVALGVLEQAEADSLGAIRRRRNLMAHEGYNNAFDLAIVDIEDDVGAMVRIARKVEKWRQAVRHPNPDGSQSFHIAPSIFGLYLEIARQLANEKLKVMAEGSV